MSMSPSKNNDSKDPVEFLNHQPAIPSEIYRWEFSGFGRIEYVTIDDNNQVPEEEESDEHQALLSELPATAICANDISSRCLFVTGFVFNVTGAYAVWPTLLVVLALYCYREVYGEVGTALPMNGGTFNVLCHTTNKKTASLAACLSIISYISTGTVSAVEAVQYLQNVAVIPTGYAVIGILFLFMCLNLFGISESSRIATVIFIFHCLTMIILIITGIIWLITNGFSTYTYNLTAVSFEYDGFLSATFYGLAWAVLGMSGYETSAQYLQEQKPGVYVKTLRNMWWCVAFFNPILSFLASCMVNLDEFQSSSENTKNALIADMGEKAAGEWLKILVSIDAFVILSGTVLTGYVGCGGLIRRMARDRCLPVFFLNQNSCRQTYHNIIIGYFLVCTSLYAILDGDVNSLSEVYIICFLGLLLAFSFGNILLKTSRSQIPRTINARVSSMVIAIIITMLALVSTLIQQSDVLNIFLLYFLFVFSFVFAMFYRFTVLRWAYMIAQYSLGWIPAIQMTLMQYLEYKISTFQRRSVVYFTKRDKLEMLNQAILYVKENEDCGWIKIVHIYEKKDDIPKNLRSHLALLDLAYPKLRIDLILVQGVFEPDVLSKLSEKWDLPRNHMFISCPNSKFTHTVGTLGGVRLIAE